MLIKPTSPPPKKNQIFNSLTINMQDKYILLLLLIYYIHKFIAKLKYDLSERALWWSRKKLPREKTAPHDQSLHHIMNLIIHRLIGLFFSSLIDFFFVGSTVTIHASKQLLAFLFTLSTSSFCLAGPLRGH